VVNELAIVHTWRHLNGQTGDVVGDIGNRLSIGQEVSVRLPAMQ
jgi:hypothetical protein